MLDNPALVGSLFDRFDGARTLPELAYLQWGSGNVTRAIFNRDSVADLNFVNMWDLRMHNPEAKSNIAKHHGVAVNQIQTTDETGRIEVLDYDPDEVGQQGVIKTEAGLSKKENSVGLLTHVYSAT